MRSVVAMASEAEGKEKENAVAPENVAHTDLAPPKREGGDVHGDDASAGKKKRTNPRYIVPEQDKWKTSFDNGGLWHHFSDTDCAR